MIDQIINAMAIKIYGLFPESTIYIEPIEQGLVEPAFYIHCIDIDHKDQLFARFAHTMPFEVVYFSDKGTTDISAVLQTLLVNMGLIQLESGKKIRGEKLHGQTIDGVGHFFVDYKIVMKIVEAPPVTMEEIEIIGGIQDGS